MPTNDELAEKVEQLEEMNQVLLEAVELAKPTGPRSRRAIAICGDLKAMLKKNFKRIEEQEKAAAEEAERLENLRWQTLANAVARKAWLKARSGMVTPDPEDKFVPPYPEVRG